MRFIAFKKFKLLYCNDGENSPDALRCFRRQDAQQITHKIYLNNVKYDFKPLMLSFSKENVQIFQV